MQRRSSLPVVLPLLFAACTPSADLDAGVVDAGGLEPDAGSSADAGASDDAGSHRDAGAGEDAGSSTDAGALPDGGVTVVEAVLGERCAPAERAGRVELERSGGLYVWASLADGPAPPLSEPLLTDASCAFYDSPASEGCGCSSDQVCDDEGVCVSPPARAADLRLTLRAGDDEQAFTEDQGNGSVGGEVTLPGATFSLELSGLGTVVTLPPMSVPEALAGVEGALTGTYDAPEAVDITWDAPAGGAQVFTHIPINHHVPTLTFTECLVEASTGELHVDEPMLTPLAVSTGLEFQNIIHVSYAAADTPHGCVEIGFFTRHYVSLF